MNQIDYEKTMQTRVREVYDIANIARSKGFDPELSVEIHPAADLAERVEGLVGPKHIAQRIRELMKDAKVREKVALLIIDEILEEKFGKFKSDEEKAAQAVRTALTLITEGVTTSGNEGISKIRKLKNPDGSEYLSIYFAGPIRTAGGTASALAVVFVDYIAKKLGLQNFRPTDTEVERYVEEIGEYHNNVSRLQYFPSEKEIRQIIKNCPVCIDGEPASMLTVSIYKNLERVETDRLRGGMALVIGEGIAQKPAKILKFCRRYKLGWDWLEGLIKVEKVSEEKKIRPEDKYLGDIVGGRPIFAYPSKPGGFRLRYGRGRNSGINAKCIHPAAMFALNEFAAIGTQLKIERPGKGTAITPCDTIEGPVVRLGNGDVVKIKKVSQARELKNQISEILSLGDMLISYGDFRKANCPLLPPGICEEWWEEIVRKKGFVPSKDIDAEMAVRLAKKYQIPLHPKYTYPFNDITKQELFKLIDWFKRGKTETIEGLEGKKIKRLILDIGEEKRILEKLCVPHKLRDRRVIIGNANVFIECFGLNGSNKEVDEKELGKIETTLEIVNKLSPFPIHDKAPTYIGSRMGRPEKAKERLMNPAPNALIPVGSYGGKTRNLLKAAEKGKISLDVPLLICPKCNKEIFGYKCKECDERAQLKKVCPQCGRRAELEQEECGSCKRRMLTYHKGIIDLKEELKKASKRVKEKVPEKTKGVIGTTNADKYFEALEKGILRSKHKVHVFKDGTIRFDATNLPFTHFKPREIQVSVEKIRELGYTEDYLGNPLENGEQILELKAQDLLLSENGIDHFIRVAKFVDDLLEKFYGLERFYNVSTKEDLLGQLTVGLAPHISAGILGRIIGFTKARVGYAHPYYHCATRRDCDGDENTLIILMDALLNFSKHFIPSTKGATQDTPLVLTVLLDPTEIDDQAHQIEVVSEYPLEFYEKAQKGAKPLDVDIEIVKDRLGTTRQFKIGFTHDTYAIDAGPNTSQYVQLKTMEEKVRKQLELGRKIRAVDVQDVASRVLNFHFMRDLYGNLRSFGQQKVRCVECNAKYRRFPLTGKCLRCDGKLVLTVHRGGIEKYLKISKDIADEYHLSDYLKQRLLLIETDLEHIFESDKVKQFSLTDFM